MMMATDGRGGQRALLGQRPASSRVRPCGFQPKRQRCQRHLSVYVQAKVRHSHRASSSSYRPPRGERAPPRGERAGGALCT